jgi:hypothetical protein
MITALKQPIQNMRFRMRKKINTILVLAFATLLANCVDVDMETSVNADSTGKGRLVYSWDSSENLDHLNLHENFDQIAANTTITVTAKREYDSEGTHYKEIEWTFKDINEVDLNGMTYSFKRSGSAATLQVLFSDEGIGIPEDKGPLTPEQDRAEPVPMASDDPLSESSPETSENTGTAAENTTSNDMETAQEEFPENQEMEEMFEVMTRIMLKGHRVRFRFTLPHEVIEAPGAKIDGMTATWEIPLINLLAPTEEGTHDDFRMIMKPE